MQGILNKVRPVLVTLVLCLPLCLFAASPSADDLSLDTLMEDLTLEELMDLEVVSPSRVQESLGKAPATVIVITRQEMVERGYTQLDQILNDLPGMDVVRPFGDQWFQNYWRGLRQEIGAPYLLMIDGAVWNHMYNHTADILATLPITNIDRVEVVYGPASSIYGANAFMGVINIITRSPRSENGHEVHARINAGSHQFRSVDLDWRWRKGDWYGSLSLRGDTGELDPDPANRHEYTSHKYLADPALWGDFVNRDKFAGQFRSPNHFRGLDLRFGYKDLQLALRYANLSSGYGLQYTTDHAQNTADWDRPQWDALLSWNKTWSDRFKTSTRLRYRESRITASNWVQGDNTLESGLEVRRVSFSWWRATTYGVSLHQDFQYDFSDRFSLHGGLKFERKNLQKAYAITYGPSLIPADITSSYPLPVKADLDASQPPANRITTEDWGVYLEGRWQFSDRNRLHLGARLDNNSEYGSATTVRGGWVGEYGPWTLKALFGQGFREPNPRVLYGGWTGSGSDPDLEPERSRTLEISARFTRENYSHHLSLYQVHNRDIIEAPAGGADNLGRQKVTGMEYHFRTNIHIEGMKRVTFWAYYSHIFSEEENKLDDLGLVIGEGRIGDLAHNKVHLGLTAVFNGQFSTTLRARYVGHRHTVDSNPIEKVPAYYGVDLSGQYTPPWWNNVRLTFSVTNLLDDDITHPGVRSASGGDSPGEFNLNGEWIGSNGFFTSLMPQPGREYFVGVSISF